MNSTVFIFNSIPTSGNVSFHDSRLFLSTKNLPPSSSSSSFFTTSYLPSHIFHRASYPSSDRHYHQRRRRCQQQRQSTPVNMNSSENFPTGRFTEFTDAGGNKKLQAQLSEQLVKQMILRRFSDAIDDQLNTEMKRMSTNIQHMFDVMKARCLDKSEILSKRESFEQNLKFDKKLGDSLIQNNELRAKINQDLQQLNQVMKRFKSQKEKNTRKSKTSTALSLAASTTRTNYNSPHSKIIDDHINATRDMMFCASTLLTAILGINLFKHITDRGGVHDLLNFALWFAIITIPLSIALIPEKLKE